MYNINEGRNSETVIRCEELRAYVYFVYKVRYHEIEERKNGTVPETEITRIAIRKAIQDCKDKSLLIGFWENFTQEEINMLGTEWDLATALEVEREEGYEKGSISEKHKIARNLLAVGSTPEFVQKITGLSPEEIEKL